MQMEKCVSVKLAGHELHSEFLNRQVKLDFYASSKAIGSSPVSILLVNDGQDLRSMDFKSVLESVEMEVELKPLVIIGIHCGPDRIQEYGIVSQPDFKGRGSKAPEYEQFLLNELLPFVYEQYSPHEIMGMHYAGFSLGGLSAFDLAWNHPDIFSSAAVFSGSLWWRSKDQYDKTYNANTDRIIHQVVRNDSKNEGMKFFFQVGELDEVEDRNRNGVIDTIDDTIDLMRELLQKGYQEGKDMHYLQIKDGRHDVATWARAFPEYLKWNFS